MRRTLELQSQDALTFDGLHAECWIISMHNNVDVSYMKNMTPGVLYTFMFRQDHFGGHSFQWPGGCANAMMVDPAANSTTVQNFIASSDRQLYANMPGTWF